MQISHDLLAELGGLVLKYPLDPGLPKRVSSPDLLRALARSLAEDLGRQDPDHHVRAFRHRFLRALLVNPVTPPDVLRDLYCVIKSSSDPTIPPLLYELLSHRSCPEDTLRRAAAPSASISVLLAVAGNPNTPQDVLTRLSRHRSYYVRAAVASNPSTPLEVLWHLADSEVDSVLRGVVSNPYSPYNVVLYVLYRTSPWRRKRYRSVWEAAASRPIVSDMLRSALGDVLRQFEAARNFSGTTAPGQLVYIPFTRVRFTRARREHSAPMELSVGPDTAATLLSLPAMLPEDHESLVVLLQSASAHVGPYSAYQLKYGLLTNPALSPAARAMLLLDADAPQLLGDFRRELPRVCGQVRLPSWWPSGVALQEEVSV